MGETAPSLVTGPLACTASAARWRVAALVRCPSAAINADRRGCWRGARGVDEGVEPSPCDSQPLNTPVHRALVAAGEGGGVHACATPDATASRAARSSAPPTTSACRPGGSAALVSSPSSPAPRRASAIVPGPLIVRAPLRTPSRCCPQCCALRAVRSALALTVCTPSGLGDGGGGSLVLPSPSCTPPRACMHTCARAAIRALRRTCTAWGRVAGTPSPPAWSARAAARPPGPPSSMHMLSPSPTSNERVAPIGGRAAALPWRSVRPRWGVWPWPS